MTPRLPQSTLPLIKALAVAVFAGALVSCAAVEKSERQKGYGQLAACIKFGMHRRQLYAVLPPMEKPIASPPSIDTYPSLPFHSEMHRFDREHYITVTYASEDKQHAQAAQRSLNTRSNVNSIDELVAATTGADYPSPENPADVILKVSEVHYVPMPPRSHSVTGPDIDLPKGTPVRAISRRPALPKT